jgi:2-dehydro-3-deoxyphosphogluconate aldolase / (4S)-4-hydroxy-2-oxoglutarate aldolase
MHDRKALVSEILSRRLSAIIRTEDQSLARDAMGAAVEGGFRLVEFTLTTPGALELVAEFAARPGLLVGAGTVLTPEQAGAAVDAGARFLVSPVTDRGVIAAAHALGVPMIPGAFTPTEMYRAHLAGADLIKLFPAPADVPSYIASVKGPLPELRIWPTNGVTAENVASVLGAGAAGAGFVQPLFEPAALAARDFNAIRRRAETIIRNAGV